MAALIACVEPDDKKDAESLVRERIADCMLNGYERNHWLDIKRICGNKAGTSVIVNGFTDASCIAKLFATIYRELYTSVLYDTFM
jgi:hypothetical protein